MIQRTIKNMRTTTTNIGTINAIYRDTDGACEIKAFPDNLAGTEKAINAFREYAKKFKLSESEIQDVIKLGYYAQGTSDIALVRSENATMPPTLTGLIFTVNAIRMENDDVQIFSWLEGKEGVTAAENLFTDWLCREGIEQDEIDDCLMDGYLSTKNGSILLVHSTN